MVAPNSSLIIPPQYLLFAQHGWADTHHTIKQLAQSLADANTHVVAPDLGYVNTWLRIEPLIQHVEQLAKQTIAQYPHASIRIIGHSMGGLIWLEVLQRHPDWWPRVTALTLVASPIAGADLARILDPMGWGIGIARDLAQNRRAIAEAIAAQIPTLVIAGDVDGGSDGTVPLGATQVLGAKRVVLPGLAHATLKNHPAVGATIQQFWSQPHSLAMPTDPTHPIIRRLQAIPGIIDTHPRYFGRSQIYWQCSTGLTVRTWQHPLGLDMVFVAGPSGECLYSGFVGWQHRPFLQETLRDLGSFTDSEQQVYR